MDDSDRLSALYRLLRERFGDDRFELWFGDRPRFALDGRRLIVAAASDLLAQWLRRRMIGPLEAACAEIWATPIDVTIETRNDERTQTQAEFASRTAAAEPPTSRSTSPARATAPAGASSESVAAVRPDDGSLGRTTFGNFVAGPSNALAFRAAQEAADVPGRFDPLLITGPPGCGKSHLLEAIAHRTRTSGARRRTVLMSAEEFTTQFVEALARRDLPGFRHKTRSVDVLLIDDVQFLLSKRATLNELIYALDAVRSRGGQAALAADRPVASLMGASPELAARLGSGLAVSMDLPEYEVRRGVARSMAWRLDLPVDGEIIDLVAREVVGGGRLIRGALNRLAAASAVEGTSVTRELAERELAEFGRLHSPQVRLADIQRAVCEVFGVESAALKSASKNRSIAEPRMLAMWLARRYTRAALSEIGAYFGRRSHSTVVSAQRKFDRLIGDSGEVRIGDAPCRVEDAVRRVELRLRTG